MPFLEGIAGLRRGGAARQPDPGRQRAVPVRQRREQADRGAGVLLGVALLCKDGRGIQLTTQGRVYWQKIAGSLRAIETATYETRASHGDAGMITLASVPTFLTRWLIPRLPEFRRRHPQVTLSFSRHLASAEDMPAQVDAAIRYGSGNWQGVVTEYIAGREFVLIASDGLAGGRRGCAGPRRCRITPCCITRKPPTPGRNGPRGMAWRRRAWRPVRASRSIRRSSRPRAAGWASAWCRASWWRTNWLAVTCTALRRVGSGGPGTLSVRAARPAGPARVRRLSGMAAGTGRAVAGSHGIVGASLITTPGGAVPVLPGNRLAIDRQIRHFA